MNESLGQHEPKLVDPEYLQCQLDVMSLCEEILVLKPDELQIPSWEFTTQEDASKIQHLLQNGSFSDLMLGNGEAPALLQSYPHFTELNLLVDETNVVEVLIRAWKWGYDKRRIDPDGPQKPPYKVIEYPGEKDLQYELGIRLQYRRDDITATQILSFQTGSLNAGELPQVSRDIHSNEYAEMGYDYEATRPAQSEDEVAEFTRIARDLFAKRVT